MPVIDPGAFQASLEWQRQQASTSAGSAGSLPGAPSHVNTRTSLFGLEPEEKYRPQITEENARQYYRHWGLYMEGADWDRLYQGDAANAEAAE